MAEGAVTKAAIDREDVLEVLFDITPVRVRKGRPNASTPEDDDVRAMGRQIGRFLEDLPGEVTVSELRELLTEATSRTNA
jgi:hypothetical protein